MLAVAKVYSDGNGGFPGFHGSGSLTPQASTVLALLPSHLFLFCLFSLR
jgi:hypothetical protein